MKVKLCVIHVKAQVRHIQTLTLPCARLNLAYFAIRLHFNFTKAQVCESLLLPLFLMAKFNFFFIKNFLLESVTYVMEYVEF